MNSESDKRLQEVKRIAAQNLAEAQKLTPCFMITQENWKALLTGFYSQLALMEKMVTHEQMAAFYEELREYYERKSDWLDQKTVEIKREMQAQAKSWTEEMDRQAGNLNEQYASALEETQEKMEKKMQENTEKLYHRILTPCLLTTLLAAVLTLLRIL